MDPALPPRLVRQESHFSRQKSRYSRQDKSGFARDVSGNDGSSDDGLTDDSTDDMFGVRDRAYRYLCLQQHNIFIQNPSTRLPHAIQTHRTAFTHAMSRMPELPPETAVSLLQELEILGLGCDEDRVSNFWATHIFPQPNRGLAAELAIKASTHIDRYLLPQSPEAPFPVPQPRPDLLYGYQAEMLTRRHLGTLISLHPEDPPRNPLLPFLVVEYKTGASPGGNLWVAANQCAGGSVASLQAAAFVNAALVRAGGRQLLNICYSLAIDNHLAFLYLSRMDNKGHFKMQRVDAFFLLRAEDLVRFHQCVATIFKWAGERLDDVRRSLDTIRTALGQEMEGMEEDEGDEDGDEDEEDEDEDEEDEDEDEDEEYEGKARASTTKMRTTSTRTRMRNTRANSRAKARASKYYEDENYEDEDKDDL
jgi:hypothetical protein